MIRGAFYHYSKWEGFLLMVLSRKVEANSENIGPQFEFLSLQPKRCRLSSDLWFRARHRCRISSRQSRARRLVAEGVLRILGRDLT
jgi:hypothetical protein